MILKRVNIKNLKPGVRLAEEVLSSKGIVLAKKDQLLDSRLLQVFNSFGVLEVRVIDSGEKKGGAVSLHDLQSVEKMKIRFKNLNLKSEMIQCLFETCIERLSKTKTKKVSNG